MIFVFFMMEINCEGERRRMRKKVCLSQRLMHFFAPQYQIS